MASIVSAGTTSATALNMSADTSGVLQLASNNGVVALTIDTSQNIGVNSTGTVRTKLMVSSSNASDTLTVGTVSGGFSITNSNNAYGLQFGSLSTGNSWIQSARLDGTATAYNLLLQPGGGNVGIGTNSPVYALNIYGNNGTSVQEYVQNASSAGYAGNTSASNTVEFAYRAYGSTFSTFSHAGISLAGWAEVWADTLGGSGAQGMLIGTGQASPIVFANNATERVRITSAGNLYVNTTTALSPDDAILSSKGTNSIPGLTVLGGTGPWAIKVGTTDTSATRYIIGICNNGSATLGGITTNGTVITYGGTSDYRLKEISGNLTGYKERLSALKPKQGTWKENGSEFRGFLAHEFADCYPSSVAGEKDAVDAEGNPKYQSMQASSSEVMADLVAYIQELETRLTALENK